MKKRMQGFVAGALAASIAVCALPSIAKEAAEQITAVYRNIKLVVDGVQIEPKDANGNAVEPFIYNGTTYLPVRAVATAFKKDVSWDGDNGVVYLGGEVEKPAKELPLWNRSYIECKDPSHIVTYEEQGKGYIKCEDYGNREEQLSDGRWLSSYSLTYPVNTLAKTVKGKFFIDSNPDARGEGVLKIYNSNGKQLYESPIMRLSTAPVDFEINIEKEIAIQFVFEQILPETYDDMVMLIENPTIISSDY